MKVTSNPIRVTMKNISNLSSFLGALLFLTACTQQDPSALESLSPVRRVSFEIPALLPGDEDPSTRMSMEQSSGELELRWEATDTIGVFPDAGSQVYFCMAGGAGGTVATFDGGAWSLRNRSQYYSYYPFVGKAGQESSSLPVSFADQRQQGISSFGGIPFYMASGGISSQDGELNFSYHLLNTVIRLTVTLPAGTYTKASLTVAEPLFVEDGHYDLASPLIVGDRYTRTLEIDLEDFDLSASATVPIYLTSAPVDLNGKDVTVEILAADGKRYQCVKTPSRAFVAGRIYGLSCPMTCINPPMASLDRVYLWGSLGEVPERFANQFAAWADEAADPSFDPDAHRIPYIQWYQKPVSPNGTCALLISGEDYNQCPDSAPVDAWCRELTSRGVQCVSLVYRTPRGTSHFCRTAWQDAQRAVRIIRNRAKNDPSWGLNPERIGVVGFSAGAHLGVMLTAFANTPAYTLSTTDALDAVSGHINWAILHSPVYTTSDASTGTLPAQDGNGPGITMDPLFNGAFAQNVCPVCLLQGQDDPYSPFSSTMVYRRMRQTSGWYDSALQRNTHIPTEVHLYPGKGHEVCGFEQGLEFLTQMGFLGAVQPEVDIMARFPSDASRGQYVTEYVWPSTSQIPNNDAIPYNNGNSNRNPVLEWHFPAVRKSKAIQILFSGGAYNGSLSSTSEVAPVRRYLNQQGITVVTLIYRYPRPIAYSTASLNTIRNGLAKHTPAWQDLQRTIRIVRDRAPALGLDPDRIGVMGSSAGGHLAVMAASSSRHPAYAPIDAIDEIPCNVQWGIGIYPAYLLTDDWEFYGYQYTDLTTPPPYFGNRYGGNTDDAVLAPEFSFDTDTAPMLLIHGDADDYAAMNSVKLSEKLRSMGVPSEVHTLATRYHGFQASSMPGTGSYNYLERISEFLEPWLKDE